MTRLLLAQLFATIGMVAIYRLWPNPALCGWFGGTIWWLCVAGGFVK